VPTFIKILPNPVIVIIFARVLYAINWFNISSISYLMLSDFRQDISMLGAITASFLIGIGVFQVPAGILAVKYSPKKIAFFGIMILSFASLLGGLATDLIHMIVLRFLVGVGMAFFFGPAVVLISSFLGKGSEGLGIGILNSAHSFGGIVGIFVWILIAEFTGWRYSLILSGSLGIISGILLIYYTRQNKSQRSIESNCIGKNLNNYFKGSHVYQKHPKKNITRSTFRIKIDDIKIILFDKSLIIIGLSLLGVQIGWNLVSTYIVIYLKTGLHVNPVFAGLVGSIPMISNIIYSPIFGNFYDKIKKKTGRNLEILLLILSGSIVSISIALFSIDNIYTIIISVVFVCIFISAGFVVPYTKAREIVTLKLNRPRYETFAISFINGLSLLGAFWVPFVFSGIVKYFDYQLAWLIGGFLTFIFIIPVMYLKR
jgi:MFS family permease